ncbi:tRNA lysidine(34) synthetase TilS [Aliidongia dinghuensis]|nr:tRNA lysidine(34) synthetase TilS [Aliidongia dinghuensis]
MAAIGPFEPCPELAVAVSGGADSLALALLADRWARARSGRIVALTVDHRLRPESAGEAAQVGAWLGERGIRHEILVWQGPYPIHDLQAAARAARYHLLGDWCRRAGFLHLLTAHHQDDQAETLILRLGRGSGLAGLSGMAPIVEDGHYRLLRPLLALPATRLKVTLAGFNQGWIEDPSNRNPAFARVRVRAQTPLFAEAGLTPRRLAETSRHLARARAVLEQLVEEALVAGVSLHPAGFALVDPAPLARAPAEIGLRALAAVIATISGEDYPPRFERLERVAEALFAGLPGSVAGDGSGNALGGGRTLGGCRILPWRGRVLVLRELAAVAPAVDLPDVGAPSVDAPSVDVSAGPLQETGGNISWDHRFVIERRPGGDWHGIRVGALGSDAAARMRGIVEAPGTPYLPSSVRPSLPAFWREGTLMGVPHLGWMRAGADIGAAIRFRPTRSLTGSGFTVV